MNRPYDWFLPSFRLSHLMTQAADIATRIGNHVVDSLFFILPVHSPYEINGSWLTRRDSDNMAHKKAPQLSETLIIYKCFISSVLNATNTSARLNMTLNNNKYLQPSFAASTPEAVFFI